MAYINFDLIYVNSECDNTKVKIRHLTKNETIGRLLESSQEEFGITDVTKLNSKIRCVLKDELKESLERGN